MCFSAQVWADYRKYVRAYNARISIQEYVELFVQRAADSRIKIPKALEAAFAESSTDDERQIQGLIAEHTRALTQKYEKDLFAQRKRLGDAERKLQAKATKGALESQRIATEKVDRLQARLNDLKRTELRDRDSRIFPGHYAPVMISVDGERLILPMRYQCRPAGKPAFYDTKYPGTYNSRRDNLTGFWRSLFGVTHGIAIVDRFYENVSRHRVEGRELAEGEKDENVVLEFAPRPAHPMLVACLWSRWQGEGVPDLLSFAAITDEPPAEVAAAGHDRCIVPIKPEHIDAWLNPKPGDDDALFAILDDRDRPYYEYRLAA